MNRSLARCRLSFAIAAAALLLLATSLPGAEPSSEAVRFFELRIRPLLVDNCFKCHADKKQRGSLRVDSRAALLTGGDQGPAFVPGKPEESLLIKAVRHDDELKMPPTKKLAKEQIADLTRWIRMGAPWPGPDSPAPVLGKREFHIRERDRAHWAFQPIKRPLLPTVKNRRWVRNPIDAFILARLESRGFFPNPPATKRELIRRVCYDLTGLPPTPREVERFVADTSPEAYEKLIDRLLASPRYGEKWGRNWLDLVRFAETNSYERDGRKPNAWRYRDYVVRAFNDDKAYDRFLREQLAGDEMPDGGADGIIATGYYRLGIWDDEPTDREQARYDGLDDIVATTGQVFLGLTVDCARCHDHKIDPIPQKDYYRLLSFFHNINPYRNGGPTDERPIVSESESKLAFEQKRDELQGALSVFETDFRKLYEQIHGKAPERRELPRLIRSEGPKLLGGERYQRYAERRRELQILMRRKIGGEAALCVTESGGHAPDTFVLLRGNAHVKGDKVEPAFPVILGGVKPILPTLPSGAKTCGRRLALANWIASPDNPLTARVMVNRIWQYHFGRGIVRSSSNFGLQGDRPTHPELLDFLADEFIRRGWSMKAMHRLILTSNAYRMSSRSNDKALSADPTNDLFWRFDMRRLTAEEIRDSILALSGTLSLKMYGPGVYTAIPREVLAGQSMPGNGWGQSPFEEQCRRSIYVHVKRSLLTPILESFDTAETDRSTAVRFVTTQPTQALALLNGDFVHKQASLFAERIRREVGDERGRQVRLALTLATTRPPNDADVRRGVELIETLQTKDGLSAESALESFCLVVLNLNEFVYLD
ncbi:MAG TPA: PSD1 and planctomycete cytochrome C domain-containing protein [Gemmataceae bacterium]|nr:PSD1 and planctomycete cytochrome C domain-containing protein [Gemmataceae bacterium]